jgi:hypothetical protein
MESSAAEAGVVAGLDVWAEAQTYRSVVSEIGCVSVERGRCKSKDLDAKFAKKCAKFRHGICGDVC